MSRARASVVVVAAVLIAYAASARAAPPRREQAKAVFPEGERNFQLGKFEAAIEAYERAFNLDPQPAFVFNIALAHRRQYEIDGKLEHLLRARELYRNYLMLDPASANRPGVERLITELGTRIDVARAGAEPPSAAATASPPAPPLATVPQPAVAPPPPVATTPPPVPAIMAASSPAPRSPDDKASSTKTWLIAGGIAAVVIGAAVTILLVTRSDPAFDGPGIDLTPR
jgi:tetratricopeptide (TPR) repeat protein